MMQRTVWEYFLGKKIVEVVPVRVENSDDGEQKY